MEQAPPAPPPGRTPFPASRVLPFGLPLVAGMGGHALFNLLDLWIVGPLGPAAIAAVTISSLVNSVAMVAMQGVSDGSVAILSRAVGEGDRERAARACRQSVLLALVLGVLLGVPPWLAAGPLTAAFGAEGTALREGTACLEVMSLGSVTMFLLMQACASLRAAGSGRAPAFLLLGANLLNVPLSIGLVHGRFGLPEAGVVGACWGTVLSRGVFAVVGLRLLAAAPLSLRLRGAGPRWGDQSRLLRLGLPVAAQWTVRVVPILVVLEVAGRVGTAAHAAYGIGSRLDQLAIFATAGWGAAAATAVGQGLGAGDPAGASRAFRRAVALGVGGMALAGAAWFLGAGSLVPLVGREEGASPEVTALGREYLRILALGYPALGAALVISMGLGGAGSVRTPLLVDAVVLLGVQVPLVLLVAPAGPGGSLEPVWWALTGTSWLLALVYAGVAATGRWRSASV